MTAAHYIQSLRLQPHPEGGYFRETYRSAEEIPTDALPGRFSGTRAFGTAIYFMLKRHQFSALHRIQADEIWHFYVGRPLDVFMINPDATGTIIRLGNDLANGEVFQAVVPAGCWFGAKPAESTAAESTAAESTMAINLVVNDLVGSEADFALVGCTVAPGFDFADFEMGDRTTLLTQFPQHQALIEQLTT